MKVLDLFSGIGGFSLGVEKAGWQTVAFCEISPYCRQVLQKHWSDIPIFEDITKLSAQDLPAHIDVICGGFPCQDISIAGKKDGIAGNRSGLWREFKRLINEISPEYAIIENVSYLRKKGLCTVLHDLWEIGYDAEWHCIPASAIGAPHQRDRIWIIAYPSSERCILRGDNQRERHIQVDQEWKLQEAQQKWQEWECGTGEICTVLSDSNSERLQGYGRFENTSQILSQESISLHSSKITSGQWESEPDDIPRLKDDKLNPDWVEWLMGYPIGWTDRISRPQRIMALGNSLVPMIPEMIANVINERKNAHYLR